MKNFTMFSAEPVHGFWGGGHTAKTDPTKVWKCLPAKGADGLWIVGRKNGTGGSASITFLGNELDVAIYCESAKEVAIRLRDTGKCGYDARYVQLGTYPGVGLMVIREIIADES